MKPGTSPWLRLGATVSIAALILGLSSSNASADKLPVKEIKRPILMGEPENPDGIIPVNASSAAIADETSQQQTMDSANSMKQTTALLGRWLLRFLIMFPTPMR